MTNITGFSLRILAFFTHTHTLILFTSIIKLTIDRKTSSTKQRLFLFVGTMNVGKKCSTSTAIKKNNFYFLRLDQSTHRTNNGHWRQSRYIFQHQCPVTNINRIYKILNREQKQISIQSQ